MFLRIEKGSSTPISRQIAEQISSLCASGSLKTGTRLPSVRGLARQLGVNPNTVLRVYERLAGDGLVEMRQGQGTFVADQVRGQAARTHRARLLDEMRQLARQGLALGMDADQIHQLLHEAVEQLDTPRHASSHEPTP
jgi:GntR family transcriptional regulator